MTEPWSLRTLGSQGTRGKALLLTFVSHLVPGSAHEELSALATSGGGSLGLGMHHDENHQLRELGPHWRGQQVGVRAEQVPGEPFPEASTSIKNPWKRTSLHFSIKSAQLNRTQTPAKTGEPWVS